MRVSLAALFLFTLTFAYAAEQKTTPPLNSSANSRRYKLSDVKAPEDPFGNSIEVGQPPWIQVIVTLGLIYFFRNGRIAVQNSGSDVSIEGSK